MGANKKKWKYSYISYKIEKKKRSKKMQKKVKIDLQKKKGAQKKKWAEKWAWKKAPIFVRAFSKKKNKDRISPFFWNQNFGPLIPI